MRDILTRTVDRMETPSAEARAEAATRPATPEAHAACLAAWPCLQTVELCQPPTALPAPRRLTVAAWNMERCKRVEDSADLLRAAGADIVLATEMDLGMARSGQRHTTRDLAAELGFGYAYGTEFVELGTGDSFETGLFADVPNRDELHGNAILSRYPLRDLCLIPLNDAGLWYTGAPKQDGQRRVGGRMALAAQIDTAHGPLGLCAVHYESESDAAGRRAQTETLLAGLARGHGAGPCLIGGDLNTAALTGGSDLEALHRPEAAEPCFAVFAQAGFDWRTANTGAVTTRAAPGKPVRYPLQRLDWLFARGVHTAAPRTLPALSERGDYLSDHEVITVQAALPEPGTAG